MTWHATEMPDDALDPDSLVGRMLNADPVRSEPVADAAELPLWRAMDQAHEQEAGSTIDHLGNTVLGEPDRFTRAAEIEALRDWLLPEEPEPIGPNFRYSEWGGWASRHKLRAILTKQARIARGD